jgi:hypothetical protein
MKSVLAGVQAGASVAAPTVEGGDGFGIKPGGGHNARHLLGQDLGEHFG